MAKGKVSEDVLKLIVEADTSKIQQEIHKTNKSLKDLQKERKSLLEQQAALPTRCAAISASSWITP